LTTLPDIDMPTFVSFPFTVSIVRVVPVRLICGADWPLGNGAD